MTALRDKSKIETELRLLPLEPLPDLRKFTLEEFCKFSEDDASQCWRRLNYLTVEKLHKYHLLSEAERNEWLLEEEGMRARQQQIENEYDRRVRSKFGFTEEEWP